MAGISIKAIRGMAPRVPERALNPSASVLLRDADFNAVELRPLPAPKTVAAGALTKAGAMKTIYRFGYESPNEAEHWFHWTERVHAVRGAFAGDTEERTYFTGTDFPRMTYASAALSGAGTDYPVVSYRLGVPRPGGAIIASVSNRAITSLTWGGGVVTAVCPEPHGLVTGDKVSIEGAAPTEFNGEALEITRISDTTFSFEPGMAPAGNATAPGGYHLGGLVERRAYAVSYVSAKDERGAPGGVVLVSCYAGQVVTLTLPTPPTGPYNLATALIWRTADASDETVYRLAGEVPFNVTTYVDRALFDQLGDLIDCRENLMPPEALKCLTDGPNGMMAGIAGSEVCFCLGYKPHAWPIGCRYTLTERPVGIGQFGQSWLVLTEGSPRIFTGIDPYAMSEEVLTGLPSCVSEASIVEVAGGVAWSCKDGLAFFGPEGFRLLTAEQFDEDSWADYAPGTIIGGEWRTRYVGFFTRADATRAGFIYDFATNDFRETSVTADAVFYDPALRELYLAQGDDVKRFAGDDANPLPYKRISPPIETPTAVCPAWAKVVGSKYPINLEVIADNRSVLDIAVADSTPFRLPGGYRSKRFRFVLSGAGHFQSAFLGQTVRDLQGTIE